MSQAPATRLLSDLVDLRDGQADVAISGLAFDSRKVRSGDVFLAMPGYASDGRDFITQAFGAGAAVVIADGSDGWKAPPDAAGQIMVLQDLAQRAGEIAARFYQWPSRDMSVLGVTGTNGKTTCCALYAQLLSALGQPCAMMGTLGYGSFGALRSPGLTTPDALSLQAALAELRQHGSKAVALEASSHGLQQGRLAGVQFEGAIFTNLTRDHLDFHGSMEAYGDAKMRLLRWPGLRFAVINCDEAFGQQALQQLRSHLHCVAVSLQSNTADVYCSNIHYSGTGTSALVHTPWGEGELRTSLLGQFNLANVLAVVAAACCHGEPLAQVLAQVPGLQGAPGRMQPVAQAPLIIVDYAHTPDALQQALVAARHHCGGRLWVVFGCGGDRDVGKRSLMGQVASRLADQLVITSDNPRSETPAAIIDEILTGVPAQLTPIIDEDRASAIRRAVVAAAADDCIVIAGKGHEDYQEIRGRRLPFCDAKVVADAISMRAAV